MNARVLVVPLAVVAGLVAAATPPEASATCAPNTITATAPGRTFTLVSFTVESLDTGTPLPTADEAGWLASFEQSADEAFGSPGVLHANSFGPLAIAAGPPVGVTP